MKSWFNSLTPSERNLVFYGSIISIALLLWMLVVEPLINKHKKLNKIITHQKKTLQVMQKQSIQIRKLQQQEAKPEQSTSQNPQQLIETALQTWRLKPVLERMQSQGNNGVQIILKNANADRAMRFLHDLERKHRLSINNFSINTNNKEKGFVDIRLTVKAN